MIFTPTTLCPLTPEPDVKKYFLKYFSLSAPICTRPVKFQLSETIWWWIGPCGEAPFLEATLLPFTCIVKNVYYSKQPGFIFMRCDGVGNLPVLVRINWFLHVVGCVVATQRSLHTGKLSILTG